MYKIVFKVFTHRILHTATVLQPYVRHVSCCCCCYSYHVSL